MPSRYGRPDSSANPAAAGAPVSGTGITRSASIGCSSASCIPILRRASYRLRPSMYVFGADDVERGRLGRQAPARRRVVAAPQAIVAIALGARQAPEDERPEAEWIADADDPALVE